MVKQCFVSVCVCVCARVRALGATVGWARARSHCLFESRELPRCSRRVRTHQRGWPSIARRHSSRPSDEHPRKQTRRRRTHLLLLPPLPLHWPCPYRCPFPPPPGGGRPPLARPTWAKAAPAIRRRRCPFRALFILAILSSSSNLKGRRVLQNWVLCPYLDKEAAMAQTTLCLSKRRIFKGIARRITKLEWSERESSASSWPVFRYVPEGGEAGVISATHTIITAGAAPITGASIIVANERGL